MHRGKKSGTVRGKPLTHDNSEVTGSFSHVPSEMIVYLILSLKTYVSSWVADHRSLLKCLIFSKHYMLFICTTLDQVLGSFHALHITGDKTIRIDATWK